MFCKDKTFGAFGCIWVCGQALSESLDIYLLTKNKSILFFILFLF